MRSSRRRTGRVVGVAEYAMLLDGTDVRCTVHLEQEEHYLSVEDDGAGSPTWPAFGHC
ncbi:hypothetical protein JBE27_18055 [Streptomyces albiflaviniger]|nr:hypothetical protein [Streptomyces albiflaviniger]